MNYPKFEDLTKETYESMLVDIEYMVEDMVEDVMKLNALELAGVDNWSGYSFAMDIYHKEREENNI